MNVLSLFDGMSCGQIALNRIGVPISNYYASEIDKYAIAVTQHHYPDTIQLGDVRNVRAEHLPPIDLLIGGSPCQGFSFAGKSLNFDDPRSALFFEFVRLLRDLQPAYFLLENVKMNKESEDVITEYLGVEPVEINSSLVSAQNRTRLYWTNIPFDLPEDKHIYLNDVIESGFSDRKKSYCLDASYYKGSKQGELYFKKARRQIVFNFNTEDEQNWRPLLAFEEHRDKLRDSYRQSQESYCDIDSDNQIALTRKSACVVSTIYKETMKSMVKRNKKGLLVAVPNESQICYRKLTPIECERLQTVPDNWTLVPYGNRMMSNTQRYKMLGNGWTIDIIAHILKGIK